MNASIVDITCIGTDWYHGCNGGKVDASNADELYIYAGYNGIAKTDIYGQNISTIFEITAYGTNISFGGIAGYNGAAEIYIPDLNKFSLNCYGWGCSEMTFIKDNGFHNASNANFNVNGCLQCADNRMF